MDRWMEGWRDGRMDGWTDGWMDISPVTMSDWDKWVTTVFLAEEATLLIICLRFALFVALSSLFNFSLLFCSIWETNTNLDGK